MRFKIFGVQVYVAFVFSAYITLLLIFDKTGLILPVLISNAIHELGHAFAMNKVRCKIIKIELSPGGCLMTVPPFKSKKDEIIVALCGAAFNFLFCLIFAVLFFLFSFEGFFVAAVINGGLCLFNMLPINGLDANTVLRILLTNKHSALYKTINVVFSILFCVAFAMGFYFYGINTSAIIVGIYLICCAVFKI